VWREVLHVSCICTVAGWMLDCDIDGKDARLGCKRTAKHKERRNSRIVDMSTV